ncbi:mitogen-activated protein kinase kinase kinase 3-like [Phalaenopsis equestris]|uniref:mitogen-activated protein kinase kinase kinase 3-like n=1 Tax=Phalaenopsis equestris TaxID=78828 RepID=UPI0009E2D593|nr:mitogen-activated protein kinase kinase kinase 3-like [Phalaenopsis equestris]
MDWVRGSTIGRGSSAVVYLAFHHSFPSNTFAVKSTSLSSSALLQREEVVLTDLQGCPQIIRCFGHDITADISNKPIYNVFLEYASGGCISGALPEPTIRRYVRSILFGLRHIHNMGYVHCDIKPDNILIVDGEAKIADFGLAMRVGKESSKGNIRGTPLYMAPESVSRKEMSKEGKDFLRCCFQKDPNNRWTAEMLLMHSFVNSSSELESEVEVINCSVLHQTPRSVLSYSFTNPIIPLTPLKPLKLPDSFPILEAVREMMTELTIEKRPDWANTLSEEEEGWLTVREKSSGRKIEKKIILPEESIFYALSSFAESRLVFFLSSDSEKNVGVNH